MKVGGSKPNKEILTTATFEKEKGKRSMLFSVYLIITLIQTSTEVLTFMFTRNNFCLRLLVYKYAASKGFNRKKKGTKWSLISLRHVKILPKNGYDSKSIILGYHMTIGRILIGRNCQKIRLNNVLIRHRWPSENSSSIAKHFQHLSLPSIIFRS